jgi:uncharacterized protein (TIGR03000 family)
MKLPMLSGVLIGVALCFAFPVNQALAQRGGGHSSGGHASAGHVSGGGVHMGGASMGRPSGGVGMGHNSRPSFPNHNGNHFFGNGGGVFLGIGGGGYWAGSPYYYDGYYGGVGPYSDLSFYPQGDVFGSPMPGAGYSGYPDVPPIPPVEVTPNPQTATALVIVFVPNEATDLWFNGAKTQSRGQKREFVTPELPPGQVFSYEVKIRWRADGKDYERTRTVRVQAGAQSVVNFTIDEREQLPPPQVVPPVIKM